MARSDNILSKIGQTTFEARKAELKGDSKAGWWFTPLELQVLPKIGAILIEEMDQIDIKDVLAPI
ncbi:MAG: hypothetical protein P8M25_14000 [Paracoccaceae bacterium]|nr:hypothetical protein [Paracoccaceae bacterium]